MENSELHQEEKRELIITTRGIENKDYTYDCESRVLTIKSEQPIGLSGYAVSPLHIIIEGTSHAQLVLNELITQVPEAGVMKGELVLVTKGAEGIDYLYDEEERKLTIISSCPIVISGIATHFFKIIVDENTNAQITLNGLLASEGSDFRVSKNAKASITIEKENELKTGLCVPTGSEVVLDGKGSIKLEAPTTIAGIGGHESGAGKITINGGRITAYGGWRSAGIGGGGSGANGLKFSGGEVTINGGEVITSYIGGNVDYPFDKTRKGDLKIKANAVIHADEFAMGSIDITSGVVIMNAIGTVYGNPATNVDWEIKENEKVTLEEGHTLTIGKDTKLIVNGTLRIEGKLVINGIVNTKNGKLEFTSTGGISCGDTGILE